MAALEDKIHKQLDAGFSDMRTSPAVLGMLLAKSPLHLQEEMLKYFISYVDCMAKKTLVPLNVLPMQRLCKTLSESFEELGLLDSYEGTPLVGHEYVVV